MPLPSRVGAVWALGRPVGGPSRAARRADSPWYRALSGAGAPAARPDDAAEERRFDRPDDEAVRRRVVKEMTHVLVPGRRDRPGRRAAADLDQEEDLPDVRAGLRHQGGHAGQVVDVAVHHGGIDLHGDARVGEPGDGRDSLLEVPGDTADAVVSLRAAAVQAERDGPDAAAGDPVDHDRVEQWRDRRRQAYRDAQRDGVIDEAEHVWPEQAVTAGEDEDRVGPSEAGHLLDQRVALRGAQLPRRRLRGRAGPAVPGRPAGRPGSSPRTRASAAGRS